MTRSRPLRALLPALLAASLAAPAPARPQPLEVLAVPTKGTDQDRGNALRQVLATRPPATERRARQVRLAAGTYDLGDAGLEIPPWVDLVGAGAEETRIVGRGGPSLEAVVAVRGPASLADLELRVENGTYASALRVDAETARLHRVQVTSDGARWGGIALAVAPGAGAEMVEVSLHAQASGQGAATGLELGARARATLRRGRLHAAADGGPAVGISLGPEATLEVDGLEGQVRAIRGELRGVHLGPASRATLRSTQLETEGGRFHYALALEGAGGALELVASRVAASGGALATGALLQTGSRCQASLEGSELRVQAPGYPFGARLARGAGHLRMDESRVTGGRPAIDAAAGTRVRLRGVDLGGGALAGAGRYRCQTRAGAQVTCDATRAP